MSRACWRSMACLLTLSLGGLVVWADDPPKPLTRPVPISVAVAQTPSAEPVPESGHEVPLLEPVVPPPVVSEPPPTPVPPIPEPPQPTPPDPMPPAPPDPVPAPAAPLPDPLPMPPPMTPPPVPPMPAVPSVPPSLPAEPMTSPPPVPPVPEDPSERMKVLINSSEDFGPIQKDAKITPAANTEPAPPAPHRISGTVAPGIESPPPPPAMTGVPASPPPPSSPFPWKLHLEVVNGLTQFELRQNDELLMRVQCERLDLHTPSGGLQALGQVMVTGPCVEARCDRLTIAWPSGQVALDGSVRLAFQNRGVIHEMRAESVGFRLNGVQEPWDFSTRNITAPSTSNR